MDGLRVEGQLKFKIWTRSAIAFCGQLQVKIYT